MTIRQRIEELQARSDENAEQQDRLWRKFKAKQRPLAEQLHTFHEELEHLICNADYPGYLEEEYIGDEPTTGTLTPAPPERRLGLRAVEVKQESQGDEPPARPAKDES